MRSKNEDEERKRKESQGNRGGEGVYIREARSIHSKRVRGDRERERESKLTQRKKTRLTAMDSKLIRDKKRRTGGI